MKHIIAKRLRATLAFAVTVLVPVGVMAGDATTYPLMIEHKFGTTLIPKQPERVATVDYAGGDNLLALGVQPLTVCYWFGDYENGVWLLGSVAA